MKDNGETIFFVMEAGEQSLYGFLYSEVPTFPGDTSNEIATGYTMRRCLTWLKQIAEGLDYLHRKNILHRDVKSGNVLLFEDGTICKVCDLDLSRKDDTPEKSGGKGTGPYMAPEIQLDRRSKYTLKVDCFSFGVLMLECLIREFPKKRPNDVDVPEHSTFGEEVDKKYKFEFLNEKVMKLLLASEPEERPSFKLIVSQLETCLPNSDLPRLQKPCVPGVENKENYLSPAPEIPSIPRTGLTLYYSVENSQLREGANC
ncbi:hypothetical protein BOX15_Mlig002175g3 [Macrostomum lignano]|uniref:Protein kinase domain-containing protein n=1 Tax=Macrostomum lignano TaxID=282301 RepID=A0A267FJY5_9PLAT|nr:hypothetical protein BOX15_Mlig002175g3 [Macrostomum lignano]